MAAITSRQASSDLVAAAGRNRIDLINSSDGVLFEEAWPRRVEALLVAPEGEISVPYIGLDDLMRNKRASGRPRDLKDLAFLEEAKRRGSRA